MRLLKKMWLLSPKKQIKVLKPITMPGMMRRDNSKASIIEKPLLIY